jgi:hypothetical protein
MNTEMILRKCYRTIVMEITGIFGDITTILGASLSVPYG